MNLFVSLDQKYLSARRPSGEVRQSTAPITRDQLKRGASVAVQCSFVGVRLGKSRGPAQRGLALFRFTFVRTKVNPRVRGWATPGDKHPGPGRGGPGATFRRGWLRSHRGLGAEPPVAFPPARRWANQPSGGRQPRRLRLPHAGEQTPVGVGQEAGGHELVHVTGFVAQL